MPGAIKETFDLPPDQAAWLPVAARILNGDYEHCDSSTRESLRIGLRSIEHPDCRAALERLEKQPKRK